MITDMLTRHGRATTKGEQLVVADGVETTVYVNVGIEPLVIDRVIAMTLEKDAAVVHTRRDEVYLVAYEDVRALRVCAGTNAAGY